ncbi:hypothetical protein CSKR_106784 [Clonorchis sinensis]|uniref:Uncharacterized protein n=1 Tax=Clonorchis sinensis TaxID=79923 RepID=A0A419PU22_CLOSI|nr:hypothetical protein CSKR_106784 [Clonorchis sinensis]
MPKRGGMAARYRKGDTAERLPYLTPESRKEKATAHKCTVGVHPGPEEAAGSGRPSPLSLIRSAFGRFRATVPSDISRHNKHGAVELMLSRSFHGRCQMNRTKVAINEDPNNCRGLHVTRIVQSKPGKGANQYFQPISLFPIDSIHQYRGNPVYEQEPLVVVFASVCGH